MTEMATSRQTGWTADDSTFGAKLALIRQRMGWGNVKEAAVACGLPPESWRRWERDGRSPRNVLEIAAVIADRTGCNYAWLVERPRAQEGVQPVTVVYQQLTSKPKSHRPSGHPSNGTPHSSIRRPRRVSPALTAL